LSINIFPREPQMNFDLLKIYDLPVVTIDNYYDNTSLDKIWAEMCFLNSDKKMRMPEETFSATKNGNILKSNRSLVLDRIYNDRKISDILQENRKIFHTEVTKKLENLHVIFRYLRESNVDTTLINYYENDDYYDYHLDQSILTCITFLFSTPKKFTGGDLYLENEIKIDCIHNRTVIFPSILYHKSEAIDLQSDYTGKNLGKYSIVQLITSL
jgi:hypothetical protein